MCNILRLVAALLFALMLYLAFTPGRMGMLVESGFGRHALAFSVLPILTTLAWPRLPASVQFLGYVALGGAIELIQGWMHLGRRAEWSDWVVDIAVTAIALTVAHGLFLNCEENSTEKEREKTSDPVQ